MNIDWQNVLAVALVVAAASYVIRRLWRVVGGKQKAACGACPRCAEPPDEKPLISIDPPRKG